MNAGILANNDVGISAIKNVGQFFDL